jgi:hypothetical protein
MVSIKVEEGNKRMQYGLVFAMQSRQFCVILSSEMGGLLTVDGDHGLSALFT